MARKPVKIVTDLQVNKQIKKTDNNNNTLFDVSGTLENGHVSSSLPLTASNIYTPGNLEVGGTITANQYHVTYQTSSVITTSGSTKFGNSSDDIHQFSGSIFVSGNVTSNNFYGTASFATTAQTASYVSSGSAIQTFVSDVRSQFSAGTDINITNGVISYTGVGGGGGVSAEEVSGAITSSTSNFASRSEVSGVLNNYATIVNVSASFATPTQVTSALVTYPSRVEVTGALSNYLLITGASSSFAELTDLTASNITNFTSDVRSQFSAGPNITINNGVITGSASGVTNVEVSGAITGALVNYATVLGVSSSFVTPSQVTNSIANFASRTEVTGVLNNYLLVTNASASFAELSDLTASNINNFSSDVRAQFSAGPNIVINNGTITGSASGASSVEVSGAITGALTSYASLVGVSSSFVTPSNVTSALEPYALSTNISSSFVVPQQVTSAITNLASRAEVTGALGNYLLISAASSSFAELTDLTASNITNFTSDVRAQFVAGPNITINDGVITGSASTGVSSLEVSGAITGALVSYLSISEASSSFAELSDLTASNISNFTSDVRSKFSAGTDISILNGQISYTGVGGGGLTTVETSGSITGSGIVSNPVTLKDPLVIGTVTASLGFSGNLNGTASYATNAATASTSLVGAAEDGDYTDGLFTDITTVTPVGTVIDRFNEILKALSPAPAPDLTNMDRGTGNIGTNSMYLAFGTGSKEVSGYTAVTASLGATLTNVSFAGQFNRIGSTNRETRLGTFATLTALSMTLNNATTADAATYTNYPADAFNVSTDGIGTYKLEINDNEVTPNGSTSTTGSATTQTFVLTAANTASFTNSGQGLNIFRHRTGTVGIPTSLWRNGHNYAKVSHVSSLGTHVTNYVDWVYDPSGSSGSVEPYVFSTPTTQSFTVSGEKRLSGIGYYTSVSYNFSCSVDNYYKNVYTTSGLTFTSATTGLSIVGVTILPPTTNESNIQVNSLHTFTGGYRLLGATLTSRLQAANTLGKTGLSTALTTNTILYDNVSTDGNTTVVEQFKAENYRVTSGSYDTQTSASSEIGAFPSSSALTSGELAVYNGAVRYPTQVLNSGNVSGSSVVYKLGNQPNYSGVTDNRGYFRVFRNGSSSKSTFTITITGGDSNFRVVPYNQALDANKVRIWIKVPEKTGWRDISTTPSTTDTTGIEFTDNFGCLEGSVIVAGSTSTHGINLLKDGLSPSDYFVLKIEASSAFTNSISNITISGL